VWGRPYIFAVFDEPDAVEEGQYAHESEGQRLSLCVLVSEVGLDFFEGVLVDGVVVGVVAGEDCFVEDVAEVAMAGGLCGFAGSDGVLADEVAEGQSVFIDDLAVAFFLDVHQRSKY
jgi:hypothetical protein